MHLCSPKRLWLALLLLTVAAGGVRGQWRIVAPNVVTPFDSSELGGEGVITYKDGILWAGFTNLAYSLDLGKTWTLTSLPATSEITAVSFWNGDSGLVSNELTGSYSTSDRGKNWQFSKQGFTQVFCGSQSKAYGIGDGYSTDAFYRSTDNGQTWKMLSSRPGTDFAVRANEEFERIVFNGPTSEVSGSMDSGITWSSQGGQFVYDSYAIGLDSCDPNILFIVSENYYVPTHDSLSRIFRSSDDGATWQVAFSARYGYLSGALSGATLTQYAGTRSNGVLRSTDQGMTWVGIGGPNTVIDSRCICAINDDTIFALDSAGNIWETFNSGGSPLPKMFSVSPDTLFQADTISCDSLTRSIQFTRWGCSPSTVLSWMIIGSDSASFAASDLSRDSILVTLLHVKQGEQNAQLVLEIDDGSRDTISLAGFVSASPAVLALSTNEIRLSGNVCGPTDTEMVFRIQSCLPVAAELDSVWITGSAAFTQPSPSFITPLALSGVDSIPIRFWGTVSGVDTARLHLAFTLAGVKQDTTIPLLGSSTAALFAQPTMEHRESVSAYVGQVDSLMLGVDVNSELNVDSLWPSLTDILATYSWDSTVVSYVSYQPPSGWNVTSVIPRGNAADIAIHNVSSTASSPLVLGTALFQPNQDQPATSWVKLPRLTFIAGQNIPLCTSEEEDSHWSVATLGIRSGVALVPTPNTLLSVYPNPSDGNVWISSNSDVGDVTIEVYDMLGTLRSTFTSQLSANIPIEVQLPVRSGVYNLLVKSSEGIRTLRVVREN